MKERKNDKISDGLNDENIIELLESEDGGSDNSDENMNDSVDNFQRS